MEERDNTLRVLNETKIAIEKEDIISLKELSNQTLHSASIYRDTDSIAIAVIVYALSKMLERSNYRNYRQWPSFIKNFKICIDRAIIALEKNQESYFQAQLKCIRKQIGNLAGNFRKHVQDVFKKAEINKASRIYEHGISLQQTAHLLGVSIWDLAEYTGQSGIADVNLNLTMPEKLRIKQALDIFEK